MGKKAITPTAQTILNYKSEAEFAKRERMDRNRVNFNCYHLRQDWGKKHEGQSREFLPKQANSIEQLTAFMQQGLIDQDNWYSIENESGVDPQSQIITPTIMQKLLTRQMKYASIDETVVDSLKMGLLGSLMVVKVGGNNCETVSSISSRIDEMGRSYPVIDYKKYWRLKYDIVRHEDFYPDPTGEWLYVVEAIEMDLWKLHEMAEEHPEIFDKTALKMVKPTGNSEQDFRKSQETGQNVSSGTYRKRVVIYECWGNIIDPTTGMLLHQNSHSAITSDGIEIIPPRKNPFWHGEHPYVVSPIIRVPKSVWHKAQMDGATNMNLALNELFNLNLDSGMMATFGIRQIREAYLEDPSQIDGGVPPGTTLRVNTLAPMGAKVMERVDTGTGLNDGIAMYNLGDREYQQSSLSNDIRVGSLPNRQVKATEIVASNQAINSLFNGIVKIIETKFVNPLLEKSWKTQAQHMNDMDLPEVESLIGKDAAQRIRMLQPAEIFAQTAQGKKFKVFGLSTTLNKIQDFRKITQLLQTISSSPDLISSFQNQYSFTKLLGEIIYSLEIDTDKIRASEEEMQANEIRKQQMAQMMQNQAEVMTPGKKMPDAQSQIPQAMNSGVDTGFSPPRRDLLQGITNF